MLSVLLIAAEARAQGTLGIAGGAAVPLGPLGDVAEIGWHAQASLGLSWVMQPIGLRLDAGYSDFGDVDVKSATANITYRLPSAGKAIAPYLILGLGAYNSDAGTRLGGNAGLGLRMYLLGMRTSLEARYHRSSRRVSFVPVTLGLAL